MLRQEWLSEFLPLVDTWHTHQWELGYMIVDESLASEDMGKLAQVAGVKVGTLKDWEKVAREFPRKPTDRRIKGLTWSHHKELARLPTRADRMKILKDRHPVTEWTTDGLRQTVNKWLLAHQPEGTKPGKKIGQPRQMQARQGMAFPSGLRLVGEESDDGKITLRFPGRLVEIDKADVFGESVIQVTPNDE